MKYTKDSKQGASQSWKWLVANRLALNIDKTNFILFHSSQHLLD